jgi:hypothetical protein
MAIAHHAGSYVQEFAGELDRWRGRIENLKRMAGPVAAQSRGEIEAGVFRVGSILKAAQDLISRADTMTAEQWMEIHPKVTAILRALQSCYNNLVADWPSL